MKPALVALAAAALALPASGGSAPARRQVPSFSHVVLVVFENKEVGEIFGSRTAPTFNRLRRRYAAISPYTALTHPSLPNYLALVSGSTQGIRSDCTSCSVSARNLADVLEAAGKTWKTYAEGLPRPGFTGASAGRYAKKHNPLLYFRDVMGDQQRLSRILPLASFRTDLAAARLPSFSLVVPDLCHDMHDCPIPTGDRWLARFLRPLLGSRALGRGVVFVVFDEGQTNIRGGGRIAALALGPLVRRGARPRRPTNHYGLLRTIEDGLGVARLGKSAATPPIAGIWK